MTIHINISYIKDIDENKFSEGIYKEDNNISLELSNDEDVMKFIVNPNTSTGYIVLISIAIILSLLVIFFIKSKKVKNFLLVMILSIPIYAYALEKIKLDVETHVEIEEINTFILTNACHRSPEEFNFSLDDIEDEDEKDFYRDMFMEKEVYEFERGMTIEDFLNSEYYTNLDDNKKNWLNKTIKSKNPYTGAYEKLEYYSNELIECLSKIKTVEYYPDMTEEEVEETYRLELEAREETNNCFRNNVNDEKLYSNDIIINSKHGSYYSTLTCPT